MERYWRDNKEEEWRKSHIFIGLNFSTHRALSLAKPEFFIFEK